MAADSQTSSELVRENKEPVTEPTLPNAQEDVEDPKAQASLHRNLQGRHMQMIAIG